jgi:hypothetical protein
LRDVAAAGYEGFEFGAPSQSPSREVEDAA